MGEMDDYYGNMPYDGYEADMDGLVGMAEMDEEFEIPKSYSNSRGYIYYVKIFDQLLRIRVSEISMTVFQGDVFDERQLNSTDKTSWLNSKKRLSYYERHKNERLEYQHKYNMGRYGDEGSFGVRERLNDN